MACDDFISKTVTPKECIAAGITINHDACIRFLSEKYGGPEKIPPSSYPPACVSAGVTKPDACQNLMLGQFMPKECSVRGITTPEGCRQFLTNKYLPKECVEAGETSKEGCDGVMFKKFAPKECVAAGVADEAACRKFMTKLLAPQISCEGMKGDACAEQISKSHIGKIVATRGHYEELRSRAQGAGIDVSALSDGAEDLKEFVPLTRTDAGVLALPSEEKIVLNIDDNIIQTAPIALMLDSDGDGLSDDIEIRFGSNPSNSDTDADGRQDGEEARQKQNPAGAGSLQATLAPIDSAILEGKTIGHPRTGGSVDDAMTIENAAFTVPSEAEGGGDAGGFRFSGKGEPNGVMTLYIYSELPVVVTVATDQYGNWTYTMSEPMREGEHEVYVVVNDNTGRVVKKSNPFGFLVSEAQAFAGGQVAAERVAETGGSGSNLYLFTIGAVILAGLAGFAGYMMYKRKKAPEGTPPAV